MNRANAEGQLPLIAVVRFLILTSRMRVIAPDNRRINVKLAGSIVVVASASLHSNELPAKAIIVITMMRVKPATGIHSALRSASVRCNALEY